MPEQNRGPGLQEVVISAQPLERYRPIVGDKAFEADMAIAEASRIRFEGRVIWNVNSTAKGGGVAEMLRALLPYVRGAGVDMRWLVISGTPEFFQVTKRLHHSLHGSHGDRSSLGKEARHIYESALADDVAQLVPLLQPHDFVLLHDPQTAGMIPALVEAGVRVIWRCHIGHDMPDAESERGWRFLEPYLASAHATVFSRHGYVPECCDAGRSVIIYPSVDPFSPKNQQLDDATVRAILAHAGILDRGAENASPVFTREDGSPARVERKAAIYRLGDPPPANRRMILQVSRWDPLKDPLGVMDGFVRLVETGRDDDTYLVLAGPDTAAVADDPEGEQVHHRVVDAWSELPHALRERIQLVSLPMDDPEENAAVVNALQRHATIVVQKSLAEGFGLTVTEAMLKARPVVASAIGGILEQIEDGVHGRLLRDPADRDEFADALADLLANREDAEAMGQRAAQRARESFLGLRALRQYAALFAALDDTR